MRSSPEAGSGVTTVGALAMAFGLLYALVGLSWLLVGESAYVILGGSTLVLAAVLLPVGVGIMWRASWAWLLGVVVFIGLAAVQVGGFVVDGVSLLRLVLVATVMSCGLYLLFAREAFTEHDDSRDVQRIHHP